jgi:hypothetical protein
LYQGNPKDKAYEEASTVATTMGNTTTSAAPGRCKPVAGKTSINSKTTTATATTTITTTTPDRVENNDIDIDSDVDDSDSDLNTAATSGSISMFADDELSDGDMSTNMKDCEWIDKPVLESQKEKDQLLKVGDVVYAPYP